MAEEEQGSGAAAVTPERILQVATGFMAAKHLFVASEVGLFAALADGPISLDQLAARTGVPRRTARILADALVALGLVEREGDSYQNGPVAAAYLAGRGPADLRALLRFWDRLSYPAWLQLAEAVRSGQAPTRHGGFNAEEQAVFSAGVAALTAGPARALATTYDWGRHRRVLDLGGGTGSFLLAVLQRDADLRGTLFELPTVTPVAQQRLATEPAGDRIAVVAGDFFRDRLPPDHDAVIVANVVHLFSSARNRELLQRIRAAISPGGRLLAVDFWTDATHTQPVIAALLAGEFLVIAGEGDVCSDEEVRDWLTATGWRFLERMSLGGAPNLLVAEAA